MSARFTRSIFQAAARRVSTAQNVARSMGRRNMSGATEGAKPKSDTPWIVGSALVFGPAFLYLVSPTARKNTPAVHNDKHDYPTSKTNQKDHHAEKPEEHHAPAVAEITMKDDEGTEANVGASTALAEESNVPKSSVSPEALEETKTAAEAEGSAPAVDSSSSVSQDDSSSERTEKSGTFQQPGEEGPTDVSAAQEAAQQGVPPKKHVEAN